jgi:hypothetical protein
MAMVSMKGEASKAAGSNPSVAMGDTQSPPRLYLEHHHLEKLGLKKMPPVGTKLHIEAEAHVGSTSEDQDHMVNSGGKPRRSMTLQLHKMDMGQDDQSGMNDEEQEEESKKGAKMEMDKALSKQQGSESKKGGKKA